jgi:hypothetical protein
MSWSTVHDRFVHGSVFSLQIPFGLTGDFSAIQSVTVR